MPKWFMPLLGVNAVMFAAAPFLIARADYESTMGLVQKIFYFHMPSASMFLLSAVVCGIASARFLFGGPPRQDRLADAAAGLGGPFCALPLVPRPVRARQARGGWWGRGVRLWAGRLGWGG